MGLLYLRYLDNGGEIEFPDKGTVAIQHYADGSILK